MMMKKPYGVTLVELMISLTIGLIVSASIIQVFISNSMSYRLNEALSVMQDDARFLIYHFGHMLPLKKFSYCTDSNILIGGTGNFVDNYNIGLFAHESATPSNPDASGRITLNNARGAVDFSSGTRITSVLNHSDGFEIFVGFSDQGAKIVGRSGNDLTVDSTANMPPRWPNARMTLISGCDNSAQIVQASRRNINNNGTIQFPNSINGINASSEIFPTEQLAYTIRMWNGVPTLFQRSNTNGNQAITPNVENMQILYGIDESQNGGPPTMYVTGANIGTTGTLIDPSNIVTMHVALLLRSAQEGLRERSRQTINIAGVSLRTPADGRIRQVVEMTFDLRQAR